MGIAWNRRVLLLFAAVILTYPWKTDHGVLDRRPVSETNVNLEDSATTREEELFAEFKKTESEGSKEKTRDAARRYLGEFPMGKYYYEIYRAFRSNLEKTAEREAENQPPSN